MQTSFLDDGKKGRSKNTSRILILDTETTDVSSDARLVQLAYKDLYSNASVCEYFKPPVSISISAMAVSHITNEMVADKPFFEQSKEKTRLCELLRDYILVAHNAPFDVGVLQNEGLEVFEFIDTLKVAKHLIESECYTLQYLRYLLNLGVKADAHDAWGDVLVLEKLFFHFHELMKIKFSLDSEELIVEKMVELTKVPVFLNVFNFGKYRGRPVNDIARTDRSYIEWLYSSEISKSEHEQNEDLIYTLKQVL